MKKHTKSAILWGSFLGLSSIILGAFLAHSLEGKFPDESLRSIETAVRYQMYSGLFLLFLGILHENWESNPMVYSIYSALIGGTFFSGSIYLLVFFKLKFLWWVTPLGGLLMIVSWGLLFISVLRTPKI